MPNPLTYPPEITIESTVDLAPEFWPALGKEWGFELAWLFIEIVVELLF